MIGKPGIASLLLLGAAAYGAYKYSQLTDQERKDLMDKGKKFFDDQLGGLKNIFGKATEAGNSYGANGAAAQG